MQKMTTIQLKKSTVERLKEQKALPQISYDEVINRLLDDDEEELTPQEIEEIQESFEQIKRGEVHSIEDVAREFNVDLE